MKKLILFGDSLFAQAGKPRILMFEDALTGYDVYNCAVGGWDTNDCVAKAPYIAKLEPDVLVISLGTNDAAPWKQVPIEIFKQNIPKIFDTFSGSKIIYFLPTPTDIVKMSRYNPEKVIEDIKEYHDAAKAVCIENGVKFIDSFALFEPLLAEGSEYHVEDGVHFNDFAYGIIAQEISRMLNKTID